MFGRFEKWEWSSGGECWAWFRKNGFGGLGRTFSYGRCWEQFSDDWNWIKFWINWLQNLEFRTSHHNLHQMSKKLKKSTNWSFNFKYLNCKSLKVSIMFCHWLFPHPPNVSISTPRTQRIEPISTSLEPLYREPAHRTFLSVSPPDYGFLSFPISFQVSLKTHSRAILLYRNAMHMLFIKNILITPWIIET